MAPRDIVPGKEYAEQILDAIEACAVIVLVVSKTSNVSRFVRNEVERAGVERQNYHPGAHPRGGPCPGHWSSSSPRLSGSTPWMMWGAAGTSTGFSNPAA